MHIFIDRGNLLKGSARIYGRNLNSILEKHGIKTDLIMFEGPLSSTVQQRLDNDATTLLIGKGITLPEISKINQLNKRIIIGILHPSLTEIGKKRLSYSNFSIVGSTTERNDLLTLKLDKPTLLAPQIEFFPEFKYKSDYTSHPIINHVSSKNKKKFTLMWHGEGGHLANFPKNLVKAINELAKLKPLQIIFVSNHSKYLPKLKCDVIYREYSEKTISNTLRETDVGIVTSLNYQRKSLFTSNYKTQKYKGDLLCRYKTVSNPARAFLFPQHGIPFVCDENPEHFIFNNIQNSTLCSSAESWLLSMLNALDNKRLPSWQIDLFRRFHKYDQIVSFIQNASENS